MRRWLSLGCAFALLAALVLPVAAQQLVGPGGTINTVLTSVTVSNTTAATSIYSFAPAPGFVGAAMHLKLAGTLQVNPANSTCAACATSINVGCNYGTTASLTLASAVNLVPNAGASTYPIGFMLDVYTRPFTLAGGSMPYLWGQIATISAANVIALAPASYIQANTADPSGQPTLACSWQFASASTSNVLTILNATLNLGN